MQYHAIDNGFIVYVEKDEKIMSTLTHFCEEKNIYNAQLSGIGAVKNIEVGAYDIDKKEYIRHLLPDVWELISCHGNIVITDEIPFIHAHVTLSDHELNTKGGHLFEAFGAVVGEFFIIYEKSHAKREMNPDIGLPCMLLEKRI